MTIMGLSGCVRQVVQMRLGMRLCLFYFMLPFSAVFFKQVHIEIASIFRPVLMGFRGQCPDEAQATLHIGGDPHHSCSALDFLVEPLQQLFHFAL